MHQPHRSFVFAHFFLLAVPAALRAQATVPPSSPAPTINLRRTLVVDVVDKTKDAVVFISTTRTMMVSDDPFSLFSHPQRVGSLGSGFIIHKNGYVVTNNHVVDRARQITVELLDGRKLPAEPISSDSEADLAILKIKSDKPFPALELSDSSDLMIGEPAIAVGNPLGYSHSVSTGIVSALHRNLSDNNNNDQQTKLNDLIQTDAAINPGNSGGPLLNAYGQVIGINTAIRSDAQNIGFAIPVNRLRDLIPQLMNPAHANRMTLPITLSESRKIIEPNIVQPTVHIADTTEIVQTIAGQHPRDIIDAYAILLHQAVDQKFQIVTEKQTHDIVGKAIPTPDVIVKAKDKLGLTLEEMNPLLAGKENLALDDGLYITGVIKESIGGRAMLNPGDLIIQIGDCQPPTLEDLQELLEQLPTRGRVFVELVRKGPGGVSRRWRTYFNFNQ